MMRYSLLLLILITHQASGQSIQPIISGKSISIRGLSVVTDEIIWVSGTSGMVGKSLNGGLSWQWYPVRGFEKTDFRDIEAFNAETAVIMAIDEPAHILKTTDGGQSWKVVFTDSTKGMFLDAMDFYDAKNGVVVGDPVDNKFFIAKTTNGGNTWVKTPAVMQSKPIVGEACFAASGTNIHYFRNKDFLFVSGGMQSRLHDDAGGRQIPFTQGSQSKGANSIAVRDKRLRVSNHFIITGGDFSKDKDTTGNCILTQNGGRTWISPATPPKGYRSCVAYINKKRLISCGTSGVDVSADGGTNWQAVTTEGYHVCKKAKKGKAIFLAGNNGRIAKLAWSKKSK